MGLLVLLAILGIITYLIVTEKVGYAILLIVAFAIVYALIRFILNRLFKKNEDQMV